jgi:hypothetical protein
MEPALTGLKQLTRPVQCRNRSDWPIPPVPITLVYSKYFKSIGRRKLVVSFESKGRQPRIKTHPWLCFEKRVNFWRKIIII